MRPSTVTHTRNSCSAFNPSKVHTHSSEHTPWTHTRSSVQPFMLQRSGSSWGFGALLKGTSVVVLRVERALCIHSPTYKSYQPKTRTQPLDYESDSITIRPRLPLALYVARQWQWQWQWQWQGSGKAVARQGWYRQEHRGVTSRPDEIKLNRQDYKYTGWLTKHSWDIINW